MEKQTINPKPSFLKVNLLDSSNLNACIKLDQIALNGLWTKKQWEKELEDSCRVCLGVFDNSNLVAFGCGWIVLDELHLTAIAVHPKYRRQGIGKKVLLSMFKEAKANGTTRATLEVNNNNLEALALYKSCGFKTAGNRRNYYKDGSDALIQWRPLAIE